MTHLFTKNLLIWYDTFESFTKNFNKQIHIPNDIIYMILKRIINVEKKLILIFCLQAFKLSTITTITLYDWIKISFIKLVDF